jgi:D-sedoheptulose 7-phosphate isomerase
MSSIPAHDVDAPVSSAVHRGACQYLASMHAALDAIPVDDVVVLAKRVFDVTVAGHSVYVFGNGGSAATADHIACDLSKNTRVPGAPSVRCLSLVTMSATITALGNDMGFESVFAEALRIHGRRGDLALAVSTSGNSPNVLAGLAVARERGMHAAALLGFEGGKALDLVDVPIVVRNTSVPHLEDAHNVINHMLAECVRDQLAAYAGEQQPR